MYFFEVLLTYGFVSRALHVRQLLLHFWISGGAFGAGRGSQRRLRSRLILYRIFESSSLAQVSCFLILLLVLKAMVGLFWKSLESSGDFSMRCQCLTSNLRRRCVGKCGEYVVVTVRGLFASIFCLLGCCKPYADTPSMVKRRNTGKNTHPHLC